MVKHLLCHLLLLLMIVTSIVSSAKPDQTKPEVLHIGRLAKLIASYVGGKGDKPIAKQPKSITANAMEVYDDEDRDLADYFEELDKRNNNDDDYGHMRYGKRTDPDDYGHMRFGKKSVVEEQNEYEHNPQERSSKFKRRLPSARKSKKSGYDDYGHMRFG